nr:PREDICTED: uncharacterized protein LOC104150546 isoform X4 [Struthio camelus australis]
MKNCNKMQQLRIRTYPYEIKIRKTRFSTKSVFPVWIVANCSQRSSPLSGTGLLQKNRSSVMWSCHPCAIDCKMALLVYPKQASAGRNGRSSLQHSTATWKQLMLWKKWRSQLLAAEGQQQEP